VQVGDGWLPVHADIDAITAGRTRLDELAAQAGRDAATIEIVAFGGPVRYRSTEELAALDAAGVSHAVLWVTEPGDEAFAQLHGLAELARERRSPASS
jgi:alkanesulfonate monooxygenase SsuD/methylene tetrahydromethanopterin reductase-like flavin-dependent oxidoreductase (luciferase family)